MWRGALVLTLAVAKAASAQPAEGAGDAYARGEAQYQAGDFPAAAASFEEAYARERDPSILFNLAQAYRFGKECAKAADAYRRFLAAVSDAPNAPQIRDYIAEQERCARPDDGARIERGATPHGMHGVHGVPPPPAPDRGRTRRRIGLAVGGAGLGALGAGGYFSWRVGHLEREREACVPCTLARLEDIDRHGRRTELAQLVAYGAGGLALAAGAWLYLSGSWAREAPRVALVPLGRGGAVVGTLPF